jgi:hypothetical protein
MAATANTMIQLNVPDGLRGRVMSVFTTVFAGSSPLGGMFIGTTASVAGIAIAVAIGGGLTVVVALGALLWVRSRPGLMTTPAAVLADAGSRPRRTDGLAADGSSATVPAAVRVEGAGIADVVAGSGPRPR